MKRLARRALQSALLLVAVSALSFAFADLAPGDYFSELRLDPRISGETVAGLRARAQIGRPLPVRYASWAASAARGDFGYSLAYGGPVAPLLWERARATLLLTGTATVFAWLLAVPLGIWAATRRGTWREGIWNAVCSFLLSVPDLLWAILFLALAVGTGALPAGGMTSPAFESMSGAERIADIARHLALPAAVLVLGLLPVLARHARAAMLEAMDAPFALAARAQGIPHRRLLFRHLLPAALNPLISLFGFSMGTLLSASLLVEVVMGWPGVGPFFLEAIMARDFAIVAAVVTISTAFLIAGNLLADLMLYRADPRIGATQ
jgi:peptide/nickel transport system permease protein